MKSKSRIVGNYEIELRCFNTDSKLYESLVYSAKMYCNGVYVGMVVGDGKKTEIQFENDNDTLEDKIRKFPLYNEAELADAASNMSPRVAELMRKKKANLEDISDMIAVELADEEDLEEQREEYLKFHQSTCLCFEKDGEFFCRRVCSPGFKFEEYASNNRGRIEETIAEFSAKGYKFINTNYR